MSFKGRLLNNILVDNPITVLLFVKYFSNWSELNGTIRDWGKEFEPNALINMDSFESGNLDEVRLLKIARQILSENDADTESICESICKTFFLISKIDNAGYETLKYLFPPDDIDTTLFTLLNSSSITEVNEPETGEIFVQPVINYCYDVATSKYTKRMAVTNITATDWEPSFTPGLTEDDGMNIWYDCKSVWKRYKTIETMPDSVSNSIWIVDYNTAVWRLQKIIEWMQKKRTEISFKWNDGRLFNVGDFIRFKHPHLSGDQELRCVIETIKKSKKYDKVTAKTVILDKVTNYPVIVSKVQNTHFTGSSINEVQNTHNTGTVPENQNF